jgi:hypothetical protein
VLNTNDLQIRMWSTELQRKGHRKLFYLQISEGLT